MTSAFRTLAPLAAAATLLSATPAFSDSVTCWTSLVKFGVTDCTSPPLRADGNFLYFDIGPFAKYEIRENNGGPLVYYGSTGAGTFARTIFGLYFEDGYQLHLWGTAWAEGYTTWAYMSNT